MNNNIKKKRYRSAALLYGYDDGEGISDGDNNHESLRLIFLFMHALTKQPKNNYKTRATE
jgi:hypothetical protein